MERTGHRDVRSLQKYEKANVKTKQAVCKSLELCGGDQYGETKMTAVTVVKREKVYTVDGSPRKKVVRNRLQQIQDFTTVPSILIEFVYERCINL